MHADQRGLFDDLGAATPPVARVRAGSPAAPLTKTQRDFNRLTARLLALRGEIAAWQRGLDRYRQRVAAEVEPLARELLAEQRAAALQMDALLSSTAKTDRLTRARRKKLTRLAVMLAETVLEAGPDGEIEAVFDRRSPMSHRDVKRDELAMAEEMLGDIFDDDLVSGHTATSVDELLQHAGERIHAKLEADIEEEQARARHIRSKRRELGHEQQASQSLRELFRRLVATLHPDREPDAAERERKTALMQRVNRAYEANDLLELLTVQLEIEEIDSRRLARASEERLKHYCHVLRDQQHALERELATLQAPIRAALELAPYGAIRPEALGVLVEQDVRALLAAVDQLHRDMNALHDPARRGALIDCVEFDEDDHAELDAMLDAVFAPPPSPRRGPKPRRRR